MSLRSSSILQITFYFCALLSGIYSDKSKRFDWFRLIFYIIDVYSFGLFLILINVDIDCLSKLRNYCKFLSGSCRQIM